MFRAVDVPFHSPTAHFACRPHVKRAFPETATPEHLFKQRFVLFSYLSGGHALNRPNDFARCVFRMSLQEQMHVVRGDMQREDVIPVPFGNLSNAPLK
jgi:hypothetical protein